MFERLSGVTGVTTNSQKERFAMFGDMQNGGFGGGPFGPPREPWNQGMPPWMGMEGGSTGGYNYPSSSAPSPASQATTKTSQPEMSSTKQESCRNTHLILALIVSLSIGALVWMILKFIDF